MPEDRIISVRALEMLDSRGNPTVEVEMRLGGRRHQAAPPCRPAPAPARTRRTSCATATPSATAARASCNAVANVNGEIAHARHRQLRAGDQDGPRPRA